MRVQLVTNSMLNGQSLQMCQDYWRPFNMNHPFGYSLEWHIRQVCQHYNVTFEELFSKLTMVKAYDSHIRCQHCGQMREIYHPTEMVDYYQPLNWTCQDCESFIERGRINLEQFLLSAEPDNQCPF